MPSMSLANTTMAPGQLAADSLSRANTGSWLNSAGVGLNTVSSAIAGAYQSRVAFNNAKLAEYDAQSALSAGEYNAQRKLTATGQAVGEEKVGQAASNIDVNRGSAVNVREATERLGTLDAAMLMYNAKKEAYNDQIQAQSFRAQGRLGAMSTAFNLIGGVGKTYESFLSGASALENQRLTFGQTGVPTNG